MLSKRLSLSEAEWQIGHSEIFLRSKLVSKLEVLAKLQQLVATCGMGKKLDTRLLACKQDLRLVVSIQTNHTCHITSTQLRDYFFTYKVFFLIEPMLILHSWGQVS